MDQLQIILKEKNYRINIGTSLIKNMRSFYPLKFGDKVMLLTDSNVCYLWKNSLVKKLNFLGISVDECIVPCGEQHKNMQVVEEVISKLIQKNYTRDSVLIALGGGVIGDLTGFIASIYQRGIRYIQIPTTLLAQVDASIGGKTAVNHSLAKNMIGSFWHPEIVIIDLDFLKTLPNKELISGMAEVVKYAVAFDVRFFKWLENNYNNLLKLDNSTMLHCIYECCKMKVNIVIQDEQEQNVRTLLNLGHSYGHAIESFTKYTKWSHGEAVSAGIVMAANASLLLDSISQDDVSRIISLLKNIGLPIKGPQEMTWKSYLKYMKRDKKNISENFLRLVLLKRLGQANIYDEISYNVVKKS
ncbi:3-dehydroquinate synthase, partial [Buchnera aphidicola (Hormaphis cornu)]